MASTLLNTRPHYVSLAAFAAAIAVVAALLFPGGRGVARMYDLAGEGRQAVPLYEQLLKENPFDTESLGALAQLYIYYGEDAKALDLLKRLKAADPSNIRARERLITYYYDHVMVADMIREREDLVALLESLSGDEEMRNRLFEEYRALAQLYSFHQRESDELATYTKLLRLDPVNKVLLLDYVNLMLKEQKPQELLPVMVDAVKQFPEDRQLVDGTLGIALMTQDYVKAEQIAGVALKQRPKDWVKWVFYLQAIKSQMRDDPAKQRLYIAKMVEAHGHFPDRISLYDVVNELIDQQRYELAREAIDQWRAADPQDFGPWQCWIYRYAPATKLGPAERALLLKRAAELFPDREQLVVDQGYATMQAEQWAAAEQVWLALWDKHPRQVDYVENYLQCLEKQGKTQEAYEALKGAIERFPDSAPLHAQMAAWHQARKEWQSAAADWATAATKAPAKLDYHAAYLYCLAQYAPREEYAKALWERVALFPNDPRLLEEAAYVSQDMGDFARGAEYWSRLLKDRPTDPTLTRNYLYCLAQLPDKEKYRREAAAASQRFPQDVNFMRTAAFAAQDVKNWPAALALWQQANQAAPLELDTWENLLYTQQMVGEMPAYARTLAAARQRFPGHVPFKAAAAYQATATGDTATAGTLWRELSRAEPQNREFFRGRLAVQAKLPPAKRDAAELTALQDEAGKRFASEEELTRDLAYLQQDSGRYGPAGQLWGKLVAAHPESFDYTRNELYCLAMAKDRARYEAALKVAMARFPNRQELALDGLYAAIERKDNADIREQMKLLQSRGKLNRAERLALVDGHLVVGDRATALTLLQELDREQPGDQEVQRRLATELVAAGRAPEALEVAKQLRDAHPDKPEYRALFESIVYASADWANLEPMLKTVIAKDPKNEQAMMSLAFHYADSNRSEEAATMFANLCRLAPSKDEYYQGLVHNAVVAGKPDLALPLVEERWKREGSFDAGMTVLDLYGQTGRDDAQLGLIRKMLKTVGEDPARQTKLADRLVSISELEDAEPIYLRVLHKDPNYAPALKGIGGVKASKNAPREAVDYLKRYVALVPNDANVRLQLGGLYKVLGYSDSAAAEFKKVLEILDQVKKQSGK